MSSESSQPNRPAKRRMPWRLGAHLLGEAAVPVVGAIAILTTTCLLLAVFDDLPDFQGAEIPAATEILYFLARALDPVETIFPFAAFLGVSFMTIVKGKNSELTAIRAAGLSLTVTAMPVWLLCLALCGMEMYLTEVAKPAANRFAEKVRTELEVHKQTRKRLDNKVKEELERQIRQRDGETDLPRSERKALERRIRQEIAQNWQETPSENGRKFVSLSYFNAKNHTEWRFADFHLDAPSKGLVLWQFDAEGRLLSRRTAYRAEYDKAAQGWLLYGGEETAFEYREGDALPHPTDLRRTIHAADGQPTTLPIADSPDEMELLQHQPDTLNLTALLKMRRHADRLPPTRQRFVKTLVAYRICFPLATLV
ncbi:MAG: LptF/LptG family permease, partial [Victivallales bacterium]|nr:LptF/LptG family permease [Victivallales bacterium]